MKKHSFMIVCLIMAGVLLSGCTQSQPKSMIKSERKLEKYFTNTSNSQKLENAVDLSEGPRLRYDAKFGPNDLNFDIKIVNPY